MAIAPIPKDAAQANRHNLDDYTRCYAQFEWSQAEAQLKGLDGKLNIAYEAIDRHVEAGFGAHVALRWLGKGGMQQEFDYLALQTLTSRFANLLASLGIQPGDTVFGLCHRVPHLYTALLGSLRLGGRLLSALLGIRPRAHQSPHGDRASPSASDK